MVREISRHWHRVPLSDARTTQSIYCCPHAPTYSIWDLVPSFQTALRWKLPQRIATIPYNLLNRSVPYTSDIAQQLSNSLHCSVWPLAMLSFMSIELFTPWVVPVRSN